MQRITPNNQLPATHFIEVWKRTISVRNYSAKPREIEHLDFHTDELTIAIFRIRENKLPTKHNFSK